MASLALPAWTHHRHPIVRGETRHWQRSRVWRATRYVLWGGSLLFLAGPALCLLLVLLAQPTYNSPAEAVLVVGGTMTVGLSLVSGLASGLNGLLASLLGATLISRERECQSWPFLRLTTLTSLEIVGGKFTALLRSLALSLHFVLGLRLLTLLAGVVTALLAAWVSGLTLDQLWAMYDAFGRSLSAPDWLLLQATALLGALAGLAWWLLEPYFGVVYSGAVALAASCLARSRGAAIVLTVAVHFGLGLGVYVPVQQLMSVGLAVLLREASTLVVGLLPALIVVLPVAVQSLLQMVVMAGCLAFSLNRAEHLSE